MKKLFAILLAAVMVLGLCVASAETTVEKESIVVNSELTLKVLYPENLVHDVDYDDGYVIISMSGEDGNFFHIFWAIEDDSMADIASLNDLSDEDFKAYGDSCIEEDDGDSTWEELTTGLGTKVVLVSYSDDGSCGYSLYSFYHGYSMVSTIYHWDGTPVTAEEVDAMIQFHTDLDFVDNFAN